MAVNKQKKKYISSFPTVHSTNQPNVTNSISRFGSLHHPSQFTNLTLFLLLNRLIRIQKYLFPISIYTYLITTIDIDMHRYVEPLLLYWIRFSPCVLYHPFQSELRTSLIKAILINCTKLQLQKSPGNCSKYSKAKAILYMLSIYMYIMQRLRGIGNLCYAIAM